MASSISASVASFETDQLTQACSVETPPTDVQDTVETPVPPLTTEAASTTVAAHDESVQPRPVKVVKVTQAHVGRTSSIQAENSVEGTARSRAMESRSGAADIPLDIRVRAGNGSEGPIDAPSEPSYTSAGARDDTHGANRSDYLEIENLTERPRSAASSYRSAMEAVGNAIQTHNQDLEAAPPTPVVFLVSEEGPARADRRGLNKANITLLILIYLSIVGGGIVLIFPSKEGTLTDTKALQHKINKFERGAIWLGILAVLLNDALVERIWRLIQITILKKNDVAGQTLRAASFGFYDVSKRIGTSKVSCIELRAGLAYVVLRGGTLAAVPVMMLSLEIRSGGTSADANGKLAHLRTSYRPYFLVLAVGVHAISIVVALLLVNASLTKLFKDNVRNSDLVSAYQPYKDFVDAARGCGSIATSQEVAGFMDGASRSILTRHHKPGIQFLAKLRGTAFPLVLMVLGMFGSGLIIRQEHASLQYQVYLTMYGYVVAQRGYQLMLDHVAWQCGLQGLVKSENLNLRRRDFARRPMRFLGSTSGIGLARLAWSSNLNSLRAYILLKVFWVQAVVVRTVFAFAITDISLTRYDEWYLDNKDKFIHYSFGPILQWAKIIGPAVAGPLLVFFVIPFSAPLCSSDGWRIVQIYAAGGSGSYGVRNNRATFAKDVERFRDQDLV